MVTARPSRADRHPRRRHRLVAGLACAATTTVLVALPGPLLAPASAADPVQIGLFGTQDPTYDGVFRQSLGLLAYVAAGETPPAASVQWLLGQQCADGGFQAYRPDPAAACTPSDPAAYTGEDTNSTALAATALHVLGRDHQAQQALAWVRSAQNADGGFPYFLGGTSDANSTAVALLATNGAGLPPTSVDAGGASAADYLASLQVGCAGAATGDDGGYAYADFAAGTANDAATVQAALAAAGASLPVVGGAASADSPRLDCPSGTSGATPAELAGGYLTRVLDGFGGAIPLLDYTTGDRKPGTISVGDTAWAVLALSALGVGSAQRDAALAVVLAEVGDGPARTPAAVSDEIPGTLALAALAVVAAGGSPAAAQDLVARVGATARTAPVSPTPSATATPAPTTTAGSTAQPSPSATSQQLAGSGATPLTPGLAGAAALLLALGAAALGLTRPRGVRA